MPASDKHRDTALSTLQHLAHNEIRSPHAADLFAGALEMLRGVKITGRHDEFVRAINEGMFNHGLRLGNPSAVAALRHIFSEQNANSSA